ncbi:hypothetical protein HAX54_009313, partial [Datura stramonium]|nr:hypothetical protein [Datura stramonium]
VQGIKLLFGESLRYTRLKGPYELTHKETHQVGLSSLSSTSEALIEDLSVPFHLVPWVPSPHLQ